HSSTSCGALTMRCKVWQLVQPIRNCFCWSEPGMLASHSPLDSCPARLRVLLSLRSALPLPPAGISTDFGPSRTKPAARIVIVYLPASMRPLGKLYSPLSLLTTVVVMVEPSFFTLTRTPSIAGSSAEETLPVRICACALVNAATLTLAASDRSFSFMTSSQNESTESMTHPAAFGQRH